MGLLDSVMGAVMGAGTQQAQGGLGGLIGALSSNPQILEAVTGMLSNDGANGGLGGLVDKFRQAGMGDVIGSWISQGENKAITGDQLGAVLGGDLLSSLAGKLGTNNADLANQLSQILPGVIDKLTPDGQAPSAGLGNAGDLMGMLGGLLKNR